MDLAKTLLRIMARAFYTTDHILVIDALCLHSTLTDNDLAHILGMQTKALRKICGKLKEDGLVSTQSRGERKEGAPSFGPSYGGGPPKERLFYRDWYYLNFHRAIDSIKYRLWKLNRHIEAQGAPTTEKKGLICPRCKSSYTELEVIDNIGDEGFYCHRCGHLLDTQEEADGPAENESMKRMNDQLGKIVALMQQIDSTTVPENDFDMALSHALPIYRPDTHQGPKFEAVEDRKPLLADSKGLAMAPEKVSVNVTEDNAADKNEDAASRKERKLKEAKQNMLPEWISKSTIDGAITTVGAKEDAQRKEHDRHLGGDLGGDDEAEDKKSKDGLDQVVMDEYWKELKAAQDREMQEDVESEDEEEDEDEFEDVTGVQVGKSSNANGATKPAVGTLPSSGMQSSNATDDEVGDGRATKKVKTESANGQASTAVPFNGVGSDEKDKDAISDEDEGELEFEDV